MQGRKAFNTSGVWRFPQGVRARILFEARSCEKLRRSKDFENIEGHQKFVVQADKSREESLVSFIKIIKGKKHTARILWRGLAKSRQPSDLPEEQGGYSCIRSPRSGDCGP
jgi:hypothetical protein